MMEKYTLRVLIAFDQFINALAFGYPNETLSARAFRRGDLEGSYWWRQFRKITDFVMEPMHSNHCRASYIHFAKPTKTCGVYYPTFCPECTPFVEDSKDVQPDMGLNDTGTKKPKLDDFLTAIRSHGV